MTNEELIAELRQLAVQIDPLLLGGPDARLLNKAADEIERLTAQIAALKPRETLEDVARREVKAAGYVPGYLAGQTFEQGFLQGVQMQKKGVLPNE